ncbi:hypothetical protein SJ05684_c32310 [Sinorhizobium sojae CCBAU 05684]|uniref:Uncharacterized protein n=1 Tax=Sinorhizobium sojae CCBAU 05684 TaxID=716928 RepID=A0A249PFC7_9HYPH|nr:hypothetical protein SJ05684_c32310 [Sinorhizobium sojae CCBAU 05684]
MVDVRDDRDVTNAHTLISEVLGARQGGRRFFSCRAHTGFFAGAKGGRRVR